MSELYHSLPESEAQALISAIKQVAHEQPSREDHYQALILAIKQAAHEQPSREDHYHDLRQAIDDLRTFLAWADPMDDRWQRSLWYRLQALAEVSQALYPPEVPGPLTATPDAWSPWPPITSPVRYHDSAL